MPSQRTALYPPLVREWERREGGRDQEERRRGRERARERERESEREG